MRGINSETVRSSHWIVSQLKTGLVKSYTQKAVQTNRLAREYPKIKQEVMANFNETTGAEMANLIKQLKSRKLMPNAEKFVKTLQEKFDVIKRIANMQSRIAKPEFPPNKPYEKYI